MKIIVNPDAQGLISQAGRIIGTPVQDDAVIVEVDDLELAPADGVPRAARIKAGRVQIVSDYRGWVGYKTRASTAERLTRVEITEAGVTPDDLGLQAEPRSETKAERAAREAAEAAAETAARMSATARNAALRKALHQAGKLDAILAAAADPAVSREATIDLEYADLLRRAADYWPDLLGRADMTDADIDAAFEAAGRL